MNLVVGVIKISKLYKILYKCDKRCTKKIVMIYNDI